MRIMLFVRENSDPNMEGTHYSINYSELPDARGLYVAKLLDEVNQQLCLTEKPTIKEVVLELRHFIANHGATITGYKIIEGDEETKWMMDLLEKGE